MPPGPGFVALIGREGIEPHRHHAFGSLRTKAGVVKPVIADLFPAYDDDGGLLVALSPRT
jgi:hypothetical protein